VGFAFDAALGYTIEECSLLGGDDIWRALNFTILAQIAFEFEYLSMLERRIGPLDYLSSQLREFCTDKIVAKAAAALMDEEDRAAFLKDIKFARAALRISD
jgi:hypothetical protein